MKRALKLAFIIVLPIVVLLLFFAADSSDSVLAYDGFKVEVQKGSSYNVGGGSISGGGIHNVGTVNVFGGTFIGNPQGDILNDGELFLGGGVFSGQIINNGILNFSDATFNQGAEIVLNSTMTFKASPKSMVPLRLGAGLAETNKVIAKLDGVEDFDISKLSVSNLPMNSTLGQKGNEIVIETKAEIFYTVNIVVENPEYGSVTKTSVKVQSGRKIWRSQTNEAIFIDREAVEAKINHNLTKVTVVDIEWILPTSIVSDGKIPAGGVKVYRDLTITVRFKTVDNVKVTLVDEPGGYGAIVPYREMWVPCGSRFEIKDNVITLCVSKGFNLRGGEERKTSITAALSTEYGDFIRWRSDIYPTFTKGEGIRWGFVASDTIFPAVYKPKKHDITISSSDGGTTSQTIVTVPHNSSWSISGVGPNKSLVFTYNDEQVAVVDSIPDAQYVLSEWECSRKDEALQHHLVFSALEFTAHFEKGIEITFDSSPAEGGRVSMSSIVVRKGTTWTIVSRPQYGLCIELSYNNDIVASVYAIANYHYNFVTWLSRNGHSLSVGQSGEVDTVMSYFTAIFRQGAVLNVSLHLGDLCLGPPQDLFFEKKKPTKVVPTGSISK